MDEEEKEEEEEEEEEEELIRIGGGRWTSCWKVSTLILASRSGSRGLYLARACKLRLLRCPHAFANPLWGSSTAGVHLRRAMPTSLCVG